MVDGGQLKNVCLSVCLLSVCCLSVVCLLSVCCLSVVCLSVCHDFVPNYLLHSWSDWAKFFLQKLEKMCI
jgi:hypothetical protein